jgi:hypothetical protein
MKTGHSKGATMENNGISEQLFQVIAGLIALLIVQRLAFRFIPQLAHFEPVFRIVGKVITVLFLLLFILLLIYSCF